MSTFAFGAILTNLNRLITPETYITIGSITYVYQTTLDNSIPYQVKIPSNITDIFTALDNLAYAINTDATNGTGTYSTATPRNPLFRATAAGSVILLYAKIIGSAGNVDITVTNDRGFAFLPESNTSGGTDTSTPNYHFIPNCNRPKTVKPQYRTQTPK